MISDEHALIQTSKLVAYSAAGTTILSGLTLSEWGVIVGILFWVLGFLGSQFWSWRRDHREALEQQQRMRYRKQAFEELDAGQWATWQDPVDKEEPPA